MIKQVLILMIFILPTQLLYAGSGDIHFEFPHFANQTIKVFYFEGNRVDSLLTTLDINGEGNISLPHPEYKGVMQLFIFEAGSTEFIAGEKKLKIICHSDVINKETVSFPGSAENSFLYYSFARKSQLLEQQGWLLAGSLFYKTETTMSEFISRETKTIDNKLRLLDDTISRSPLYAARFLQWADFMNRLYDAEQSLNQEKVQLVVEEMEKTADIISLYHSGQLWGNVHNYYISLFNRMDSSNKKELYAFSINKIIDRLEGLYREGFVVGSIQECERFGWGKSEGIILQHLSELYPDGTKFQDGNLQRLTGIHRTQPGKPAPEIMGIDLDIKELSTRLLMIFYESGCNSCEIQIEIIKKNYKLLQQKGIRVISIAADHDQNVYNYHSRSFPWIDKFCDYKGFEGENFKNYGVVATPTIYVINKDGQIEGRYANLTEAEVLN